MMHPTDTAKELWRCQASDNIDEHATLCAIDNIVVANVRTAALNWCDDGHIADFEGYKAL